MLAEVHPDVKGQAALRRELVGNLAALLRAGGADVPAMMILLESDDAGTGADARRDDELWAPTGSSAVSRNRTRRVLANPTASAIDACATWVDTSIRCAA